VSAVECKHDECLFVDRTGVQKRFVGPRGTFADHRRLLAPHPCCKPEEGILCTFGLTVKKKSWKQGKLREVKKEPVKLVECLHSGCNKTFLYMASRSKHHRVNHPEPCKHQCSHCEKQKSLKRERIEDQDSDEPPHKRQKTTETPNDNLRTTPQRRKRRSQSREEIEAQLTSQDTDACESEENGSEGSPYEENQSPMASAGESEPSVEPQKPVTPKRKKKSPGVPKKRGRKRKRSNTTNSNIPTFTKPVATEEINSIAIRAQQELCFNHHGLLCPPIEAINMYDNKITQILSHIKETKDEDLIDVLNEVFISEPEVSFELLSQPIKESICILEDYLAECSESDEE